MDYAAEEERIKLALKRGKRRFPYPINLIFYGILLLYALDCYASDTELSPWAIPVLITASIIFKLLDNYSLFKWKLWAYDQIRNVHTLKERAIAKGILSLQESFLDNINFASEQDKDKLKELENKFEIEDQFSDDETLAAQTILSKQYAVHYLNAFYQLIGIIIGIASILQGEDFGILIIIVALLYLIANIQNIVANKKGLQKIQLDITGIALDEHFFPWDQIKKVKVENAYSKSKKYSGTLFVCVNNEILDLKLSNFPMHSAEINRRIEIYKTRFREQNIIE